MTETDRLAKYKESKKHPRGPTKRLYSVPEAAFYLGRTVDALREIIWAGRLPYVKDGRRVLIDVKDMDEFIERNKKRFTF
jgi:excisionase family DNA binding protein